MQHLPVMLALLPTPPPDTAAASDPTMPAAQNRRSSITSSSSQASSGLPRSRACITCRRRKVKCGEEKPHCLRCVTRGCDCEGYDSAQARGIKTQQALLKRWRPEANKPGKNSLKNLQHVFAVSFGADDASASLSSSSSSSSSQSPPPVEKSLPSDIPTIRSPAMVDSRIFRAFLDNYMPSSNEPFQTFNPWLYQCLESQDAASSPTLNTTLRAVALTRVGRTNADEAMVAQGKQLYVQALHMLQKVSQCQLPPKSRPDQTDICKNLLNPDEMSTDAAVLSARALGLYELFEHSDAFAWFRHQQGLEVLVQARGPKTFKDDSRQGVLAGFKDVAMIKALISRRKPFLTSGNWRTEPMANPQSIDDFQEAIIDIGLLTAECIAECNESVDKLEQGILSLEDVDSCYAALTSLDRHLANWMAAYSAWMRGPLYTVHSEEMSDMDSFSESSSGGEYQDKLQYRFPTFKHAVAMLSFWTITLLVDMTLEEYGEMSGVPWEPPLPEMLDMDARRARRLEICAHMLRGVSTLMLKDLGSVGATRCLLPWDVAMGALQKEDGPMAWALLRRGKDIHLKYVSSKGMGIVGRNQFKQRWNADAAWQPRGRIILMGTSWVQRPLYMDWECSPATTEESPMVVM